jgi:site-specific DNA recombinase
MRESGSCSNRKAFYLDDVENAVLGGLQKHLKAPHLLKEFAKAYQEERERLANKKRRARGKLESRLAQIQRSIDRQWADYEAERVPVEIAGPKLKELQAQRVIMQAELAAQPDEERIVGLHPQALRRYENCVARLEEVFRGRITRENEEAATTIRNLIERITVCRKGERLKIQLQGRLALLMDAPRLGGFVSWPPKGGRQRHMLN